MVRNNLQFQSDVIRGFSTVSDEHWHQKCLEKFPLLKSTYLYHSIIRDYNANGSWKLRFRQYSSIKGYQ